MCNLYTTRRAAAEVAEWFKASAPVPPNVGGDIVPGYPGMVVREAERRRVLQSMTWGFPLAQKSKVTGKPIKPKPINNVGDITKPMWRGIAGAPRHRCRIPLTEFAGAEGVPGAKTRTWIRVKGESIFAWAGFWRTSVEWSSEALRIFNDLRQQQKKP